MSKSVLVMDTPERGCVSCLIGQNHSNSLETCIYCPIAERCVLDKEAETIPDWCPLRPLPEKRDTKMTGADWNCGYNDGWNACVDEIIIRSKSPEEIIKYYENKNIQIKRKAAQEAQTSALTTPLEKPLSNAMFNGMLWKIV